MYNFTALLPSHICISLDSPSLLKHHILVTVVVDRFLKHVITSTMQAPIIWKPSSSTLSQMDLVFIVIQQKSAWYATRFVCSWFRWDIVNGSGFTGKTIFLLHSLFVSYLLCHTPGLRLKIKHDGWLLADTCPRAANYCALF